MERERLDKVLKGKELAQSRLVQNEALETSSLLGADNAMFHPANLDQFRAQVLAQMSRDLEKAVREARE